MTDNNFVRSLEAVLVGVRQLEDFAGVLVGSAVEDALLCVARDYGHDYGGLLAKYRDGLVRRHAGGLLNEGTSCRGFTRDGKPCPRRATLDGHCKVHAAARAEELSRRRNVEAYQAVASSKRREDDDRLVELWTGRPVVSSDAYACKAPL